MKKNVIVEFIHELGDGGASALVKDYSLLLTEGGFRVVVIVVFPAPNAVTYSTMKRTQIEILSVFEDRSIVNRVKNKFFAQYYIVSFLKRTIEGLNPIAVHAHLAVLRYLVPISKSLIGCNVLFTCHSLPSVNLEGKNSIETESAKYLLKNNNLQMIALHDDMAEDLNRRFKVDNTVVIRNGIDFSRFKTVKDTKEEIRAKKGFPIDAYIIGHVGRFATVKNHRFLLKVFKEVKHINRKALLMLVGTGELLSDIKKQIHEIGLDGSVRILTHRTDIPELMKAMDIFVLPSLYEGFCLACLEAQIMGIPCVVSDTLPKQVYLSKSLTTLSLNEPIEVWTNAILNPSERNKVYGNINDYDINNEIKKLKSLYLSGSEKHNGLGERL